MIEAICCNMDIQFLGSGPSTKAVIYYITDYITKAQLKTHVAYAALALAVQKLENVGSTDLQDMPTLRAKKLLQKCAYSMISHQELSGQQVSSYLMDLEDHYTSHYFQPLYWSGYERLVNQTLPISNPVSNSNNDSNETDIDHESNDTTGDFEPLPTNCATFLPNSENSLQDNIEHNYSEADIEEVIVTTTQGELEMRTSAIQDYLLRGESLKSLSLWEYTLLIQKISKKHAHYHDNNLEDPISIQMTTIEDNKWIRPKYQFDTTHPNSNTHIQQLWHPQQRPLSTPIGPSLPRRDKPDDYEKYCRLMLILLKPWTTPSDLLCGCSNFADAFQTFIHNNNHWKPLLNNMQLLHECRDNRDDHFESRSRLRTSYQQSGTQGSTTHEDDDFESDDIAEINQELLNHLVSIDDSRSIHLSQSRTAINQSVEEARLQGLFRITKDIRDGPLESDQAGHLADTTTMLAEESWRTEYENQKRLWKAKIVDNQKTGEDEQLENKRVSSNRDNIITSIVNSTEPSNQMAMPQKKDHETIKDTTHLNHILSMYTLNEMQGHAFKIIAEHSLAQDTHQLRMHIAGSGGTGKSRVIDALQEFFQLQDQSYRLRLTSFTGVAAKNINGMTLHSALNLGKHKKWSDKKKGEIIAMWRRVDYLIIDEVSMIGCKLLLEIHEVLCEAKENTNLFGGINIIFVGDFAQLPPVGDVRLYSHIKQNQIGTVTGQKNVFGRLLWLSVDKVIILHENV